MFLTENLRSFTKTLRNEFPAKGFGQNGLVDFFYVGLTILITGFDKEIGRQTHPNSQPRS
jgi:hypothetical protein